MASRMVTTMFPSYEWDTANTVRRFDHADDEGVIVAFCPNPEEAMKITNALMAHVEHGALIGILNRAHDALRDIQEKLDSSATPPGA